jgi:hypothetical protein
MKVAGSFELTRGRVWTKVSFSTSNPTGQRRTNHEIVLGECEIFRCTPLGQVGMGLNLYTAYVDFLHYGILVTVS